MKRRALWPAIGAAGVVAAGWALHRLTHPVEARLPDEPQLGSMRPMVPDHLFDLPDGVTEQTIPSHDGGTIRYLEAGEGQPLVLLHGITLRSDVWSPQFHTLTDRFRVISVDLRGHGGSEPGEDGFGLHRLGADVATLLETLDLHDAIVVGHSMGGMTVMTFCRDHPEVLAERVAGVAFVATSPDNVFPPIAGMVFRLLVDRGRTLHERGGTPPRSGAGAALVRAIFGDRPNPRAIRQVVEMGADIEFPHLLSSIEQMFVHDTREDLRSVRTPALVLVGTRDVLTPPYAARRLAAALPDRDFVLLPRAGHQLMQERPDEFDRLIRDFADRTAR